MPHAIYLHSSLTQDRAPARNEQERRTLLRYSNIEVVVALTIAGLVNMAMVMMAAAAFHGGHEEVAEIETAYHTLVPLFGGAAAGVFMASLNRLGPVELGRGHDGGPGHHAGASSVFAFRSGCGVW